MQHIGYVMRDLSIAALLCVLSILLDKYQRLKTRVSMFDGADERWPCSVEKLGKIQVKAGEVLEREPYDSAKYQETLDFWFGVSELINYWVAVHPATIAEDATKRKEADSIAVPIESRN